MLLSCPTLQTIKAWLWQVCLSVYDNPFPIKPELLINSINLFWKTRWTNSWTSRLQPTCHSRSSGFLVFFTYHTVTNEDLAKGPTKFPFMAAPLLQPIFASLLFLSDLVWNWDGEKTHLCMDKEMPHSCWDRWVGRC